MDEHNTFNFGAYLDRTLKRVRLDMHRRFKAAGADITPEQWVLLSALQKNDGISQSDLANGSFKDAPTVSRIIDLLAKKGLVERKRVASDRRSYQVFLTDQGRETIEKVLPAVIESRMKGWKDLNKQDYADFLRIINQIFVNFGEKDQTP